MSQVIRWSEQTILTIDPTERLVKHFSWEEWLVSPAVIDTSVWEVTDEDGAATVGLAVDEEDVTNSGLFATCRLVPAAIGTYELINTVTTDETPPQIGKRSVSVVVRAL